MANDNMKYLAVIGVVVVFVVGLGAGMLLNSNGSSSGLYHLTLVVTDNNQYSLTSNETQPAYYILADNGSLLSTANINVPINTKIALTIINYDDGADTLDNATFLNVAGTQSNQMLVVSDDNVNSTSPDNKSIDINSNENMTLSKVPADSISHTFSVFNSGKLLLNIPVEPSSTSYAVVTFTTAGTFHWQCEVPCGSGASGWGAAMATGGWLEGNVIVK